MNRLILSLALLLPVAAQSAVTQDPGVTFYVQLIHCDNAGTPPTPHCHRVGPKLSQKLESVFKWTNYWELKRSSVLIKRGEKVRKAMSPDHQIEIELLDPQKMAIRIYVNGQLTRTRTQPVKGAFCMAGGSKGTNQAWFIVVRQDEPQERPRSGINPDKSRAPGRAIHAASRLPNQPASEISFNDHSPKKLLVRNSL